MRAAGAEVAVAIGIDAALTQLEDWRLLRSSARGRTAAPNDPETVQQKRREMNSGNPFAGTTALNIVRAWEEFTGADFLKADNAGTWSLNDMLPDPGPYLPLNYRHILQRWGEEKRATIID
jgi:hypothetical protein